MLLINYFDLPSTHHLGTLYVKTSDHVVRSCFAHLPSHCGDSSREEGKIKAKIEAKCCLSPLENFIDGKEVPKRGKISDTSVFLCYLINVR